MHSLGAAWSSCHSSPLNVGGLLWAVLDGARPGYGVASFCSAAISDSVVSALYWAWARYTDIALLATKDILGTLSPRSRVEAVKDRSMDASVGPRLTTRQVLPAWGMCLAWTFPVLSGMGLFMGALMES